MRIWQPVQVLNIGTAPYFLTFYDDGSTPIDKNTKYDDLVDKFSQPNSNPALPYQFPEDLGLYVYISPTAGSSTLKLSIAVGSLPKAK